MFQRILVPLDGSTLAERALPVAARLARACGGTVILFRALSFLPELVSYMAFQQIAMAPSVRIELGKYKVYLDRTASKEVLGSVAEKVARLSTVPVLLLRSQNSHIGSSIAHEEHLQVLIPLDGLQRVQTAIVPAGQVVSALSAPGQGGLHLPQVLVLPGTAVSSSSQQVGKNRGGPDGRKKAHQALLSPSCSI